MMVPARSLADAPRGIVDTPDIADVDGAAPDAGVDVGPEAQVEVVVEVAVERAAEADRVADTDGDLIVEIERVETESERAADSEPDSAADTQPAQTPDETTGETTSDTAAGPPADSANVVALFPGKVEPEAHSETDALFARLRSGATDDADGVAGGVAPDGAAESIFDRRDAALVPLIVAGARKLKRVLADEQNDVLDALRKNVAVTELTAILPPDRDHAARYVEAIGDELLTAAVAGAGTTGDASPAVLRKSFSKSSTLDPVRNAIAADLVASLRERLSSSVADGAGDNDDITKRVRAVYREWKVQHIDDELDDVFRLAYGVGALAAAAAGTRLCWMVDPHGPACPDAEDNALAGPVGAGDPYPTGHTLAPAHAGCRCLLAPVSK
jgi:hypothetical protein